MDLYKLNKAVDNMALAVGNSDDALRHFTCEETDSMLAVMALCGYEELAGRALFGHVTGEDEGDRHEFIRVALDEHDTTVVAEQMCATYVEGLKR